MSSTENNKTELDNEKKKSKPNTLLSLILICIAFIVPLGLWFSVVYNDSGGIANLLLLFAGTYGFGLLITLCFIEWAFKVIQKVKYLTFQKIKYIQLPELHLHHFPSY